MFFVGLFMNDMQVPSCIQLCLQCLEIFSSSGWSLWGTGKSWREGGG